MWTKTCFVFGEFNGERSVLTAFDRQSGECIADDLFRTKGGRAVVIEAMVNFEDPSVQVLSPWKAAPHPGIGTKSEPERLKHTPRWRRWLHRM